jgi:hypothetical protein
MFVYVDSPYGLCVTMHHRLPTQGNLTSSGNLEDRSDDLDHGIIHGSSRSFKPCSSNFAGVIGSPPGQAEARTC